MDPCRHEGGQRNHCTQKAEGLKGTIVPLTSFLSSAFPLDSQNECLSGFVSESIRVER